MSPSPQPQSAAIFDSSLPIIDIGGGPAAGIYLLRIVVAAPLSIVFGRFRLGQPIVVQSGQYLYIGSAQNAQGAPSLARRVLRHLSRSNGRLPHALRERVATYFAMQPPTAKRLHWHIDYLLDHPQVQVDQIVLLRTVLDRPYSGEADVAQHLNHTPDCHPIVPGLGASDHPGSTHLLSWRGTDDLWRQTLAQLVQFPTQWAADR